MQGTGGAQPCRPRLRAAPCPPTAPPPPSTPLPHHRRPSPATDAPPPQRGVPCSPPQPQAPGSPLLSPEPTAGGGSHPEWLFQNRVRGIRSRHEVFALTANSAHNASVKCDRMRSQKPRRRPDACHAFHPEVGAAGGRGVGLVFVRRPQLCAEPACHGDAQGRTRTWRRSHVFPRPFRRQSHVSQGLGLQVPMLSSVHTTSGDRPLLAPAMLQAPELGAWDTASSLLMWPPLTTSETLPERWLP